MSNPVVFKANGDIRSTSIDSFWNPLSEELDRIQKGQTLELDLRATNIIDSVGLNAIVKSIRTTEFKGAKIRIRIGSERVRRIFVFTRLDKKAEILLN